MAAGTFTLYGTAVEKIAKNTIDLDGHAFKCSLHASGYTPSTEHSTTADLTNEVANGNGYTTGGETLGSVTVTRAGAVVTFDAADVSWTATGGSVGPARRLVIYSTTGNHLLGHVLLDSTPADVTISSGSSLTIAWAAGGIFTMTAS